MPLYEYVCAACGHRLEILQRIGESGEGLPCPRCGERRLDKQFSTFASASTTGAGPAAAGGGCGPGGFR